MPPTAIPTSIAVAVDYSDAPDIYGIASHIQSSSLFIGLQSNGEAAAENSSIDGDDSDDGVSFGEIGLGEPFTAFVTVVNNTGEDAMLVGYVDLNGDGVWECTDCATVRSSISGRNVDLKLDDSPLSGEEVRQIVPSNEQPYTVVLPFGVVTNTSNLYGRFRLTTDMDVTTTGNAPDGEVEDYLFTLPTAVKLSVSNSHVNNNGVLLLLIVLAVGNTVVAAGMNRLGDGH